MNGPRAGAPIGVSRAPQAVLPLHASIAGLHRWAGNRAVTRLLRAAPRALQRKVGWSDASTQGRAWNLDERAVGNVRRIPLEGLSEGLSANRKDDQARRKWDKDKKKWVMEPTSLPDLTSESAKGKAIVLVPKALDARKSIEVVVFLHGFTEDPSTRPFAGWRALTDPPPKGAGARLKQWRQGVDPAQLPGVPDTAPVRDVALDEAEQQLEESARKQLVVVLPQGGLHSQFGKEGGQDFLSGPYVAEIVSRLRTEKRWQDGKGSVVDVTPAVARITMAGHSGAGATLASMADRSVAEAAAAKRGRTLAPGASSALTGDLVIYDAINGDQLTSFVNWATMRLDEDLAVLTDTSKSDAEKLLYLQGAQKLRGYTTDYYIKRYIQLDDAINRWFARHKSKLGAWAPCLRANYVLEYLDVEHEELMRGSVAGTRRARGTGTIADAISGLHPPLMTSPGACPAMPKPLSERWTDAKRAEQERAREQRKKAPKRRPTRHKAEVR